LSDAVDHGITVTEIAAMDQPIDVSPETTAAFVGRALRGPVNTPVLVKSFGDYRRRFGDIWSRSSLGPAVRQFFDHGGLQLYVVRVANNARGSMICLPASGSALVLRAVEPGSTEFIRAAVDYDGIDDDEDLFDLTLQRVNPGTGHVDDQELFRRVSYLEEHERFAGDALLTSSLARIEHPHPSHRPEPTIDAGGRIGSTYVSHVQAGTDGTELSDYDLVGSRKHRSGLFALEQVENFDILYLPPPGKGIDTGPAAILAAELYCRERRAMLVVDPRNEWTSAEEAVRGVRDLGYASPNMLGYFPRMLKRRSDDIARPAGGAIAGLLCKQDRTYGPWQDLDQQGMGLHRHLLPAVDINDEDARLLNRAGLNVIADGPARRCRVRGSVTMGRGSEVHRKFARLPVRRTCLQIISTVSTAARWAVFEPGDKNLARRVRAQVLTYFYCLNDLGAFANDRFIVECDAGVSKRDANKERGITVLLVFQPAACDESISLTLHLTATGCRVGSAAFSPSVEDYS
jgi:phage tail sheath protein FI